VTVSVSVLAGEFIVMMKSKPPVSAGKHETYKMSGALCSGPKIEVPRIN
jgi:hypothetical protein